MEASPNLKSHVGPFAAGKLLAAQPDRVVCALALRGNPGAYEVLYARYQRPIHAFIYHLLGRAGSAQDAEDIVQETFSTAFGKLAERRHAGSFKSWLYTIARNRTVDHLRVHRPVATDLTDVTVASGADLALVAENSAEMHWLVGAMHELPDRQRDALVMMELGGMSQKEIAADLGTTPAAVKKLVNRARDSLGEASEGSGYSRRRVRRELHAAVPVLPLAATGGGLAAFGVGGATATGVGGVSVGVKAAAVAVFTAAAVGGGAVGSHTAVTDQDRPRAAGLQHSSAMPGSGGSGSSRPDAGTAPAAGDSEDRHKRGRGESGDDSRGGDDDSRRSSGRGDDDDHARSGSGRDDASGSGDERAGQDSGAGESDEPDEPENREIESPQASHESSSGGGSGSTTDDDSGSER
ncbi:MAG: RNA polymerase sigma factor [Solirubrobacterales bacterium]